MPEPSSPNVSETLKSVGRVSCSFQSDSQIAKKLRNLVIFEPRSALLCLKWLIFGYVGTQRRTKKVVHHQEVNEDKKLKSTIKKFGMQPLQDIDEVNMFREDNTIMHLKRPTSKYYLSLLTVFQLNFPCARTCSSCLEPPKPES